jgi:hypothetical protein
MLIAQTALELPHGPEGALDLELDAADIVDHPAGETKLTGGAVHEGTEAHSLHGTENLQPSASDSNGSRCVVVGWHVAPSIASEEAILPRPFASGPKTDPYVL